MIIAIIKSLESETCLRLSEAYLKGGVSMVEVSFDQKSPETWKKTADAIKSIRDRFGSSIKLGAGTVLTEEQLKICEDAGGEYMVAPNVNPSLVRKSVADGLPAIPGAMTATEAVEAWNAGASYVKIFPASSLGPGYVKSLTEPLSHIPFLAFAGITPDNIADYIKAGCVGAGVGGYLSNPEWIKAGEWDKITAAATLLVESENLANKK